MPRPEAAGDYDVLVKMKACGVWSDVHNYLERTRGVFIRRILGHGNAAWSKRSAVTRVKRGGTCRARSGGCLRRSSMRKIGRYNVCEHVRARGSSIDGTGANTLSCRRTSVM